MSTLREYMYLYKVELPETGEFYIGSRRSKVEPELDTKYKGSMKTWRVDKSLLKKEILVKFPIDTTKESLLEHEADLIELVINHELNRNYHIPNNKFYMKNAVSDEAKLKKSIRMSGCNNPMYGKPGTNLGTRHHEEWINKMKLGIINYHRKKKGLIELNSIDEIPPKRIAPKFNSKEDKENKSKSQLNMPQELKNNILNAHIKSVIQYSLNGDFICEFKSFADAARNINKHPGHIVACAKNKLKHAYGFVWKYKIKEN